jgi:hypothetical protein
MWPGVRGWGAEVVRNSKTITCDEYSGTGAGLPAAALAAVKMALELPDLNLERVQQARERLKRGELATPLQIADALLARARR